MGENIWTYEREVTGRWGESYNEYTLMSVRTDTLRSQ